MEYTGERNFVSLIEYANGTYSLDEFDGRDYSVVVEELRKEWDEYPDINAICIVPYDKDEYPVGNFDMVGEYFYLRR